MTFLHDVRTLVEDIIHEANNTDELNNPVFRLNPLCDHEEENTCDLCRSCVTNFVDKFPEVNNRLIYENVKCDCKACNSNTFRNMGGITGFSVPIFWHKPSGLRVWSLISQDNIDFVYVPKSVDLDMNKLRSECMNALKFTGAMDNIPKIMKRLSKSREKV